MWKKGFLSVFSLFFAFFISSCSVELLVNLPEDPPEDPSTDPSPAPEVECSAAEMTSPEEGSTFEFGAITFEWTEGTGAEGYRLDVGSEEEGIDIYNGELQETNTPVTVEDLLTDGSTIYATLLTECADESLFKDYSYTAFTCPTLDSIDTLRGEGGSDEEMSDELYGYARCNSCETVDPFAVNQTFANVINFGYPIDVLTGGVCEAAALYLYAKWNATGDENGSCAIANACSEFENCDQDALKAWNPDAMCFVF